MELSLKLYKLIDGVAIPFPNAEYQATLADYSYSAKRMGNAPSITATLKYAECLDGKWDDNIYLEFRGERYLLKNTPTSSYDSSAIVHTYNVEFVSERVVLESVYFFDVVKEDTEDDLPASNSSDFSFFGDVMQFAKRLQRSMAWSGVDYTVVVDEDVVLEEKLYESQDQYISAALQTMYEVYKVPYYFVGKEIHIGYAQHIYKEVLKYGAENSLISISKNNAGNELINRVTGVGSDRNIPYYYPNPTPKGYLKLDGSSKENYRIVRPKKFANAVDIDRPFSLTVAQSSVVGGAEFSPSFSDGISDYQLTIRNDAESHTYKLEITIKTTVDGYLRYGYGVPAVFWIRRANGERISMSRFFVSGHIYSKTYGWDHNLHVTYDNTYKWNRLETDIQLAFSSEPVRAEIILQSEMTNEAEDITIVKDSDYDDGEGVSVALEYMTANTYEVATNIDVLRNATGHIYIKNSFAHLSKPPTTLSSNFVSGMVLSGEEEVSIALIQTDDTIYCGNLESGNYTVKCYYTLPYPFTLQTVTVSSQSVNKGRWQYIDDNSFVDFTEAGLAAVDGYTPINGDTLIQRIDKRVTVQNSLMPSIYRESDGAYRFYNAENGEYKDEDDNDIVFEKEYSSSRPREFIYSDEEIYPSIEGMTNGAFEPIDEIIDVAFDDNDNDDIYPVGHDKEGKYMHPYFFVKLHKFSGTHSFNLFDHAIEGQTMTVSMKTGKCGGCNFNIGVDEATGTFNPVQVDNDGNLVRDNAGNIMLGPKQERQNDTSKYEVWLALKKEEQTFGVIMPNVANSYRPAKGDKFVLLNIDLPEAYVTAAEKRLERATIKHMAENNAPKFNFSAKLSRIFFAENESFASSISENCKINVEFCGEVKELYISSIKYRVDNKPLPEVTIELDDEIKVLKGALSKGFDGLKTVMTDNFRKFTGTVYEAQDVAVTAKKQATDAKKQTLLVSETTLTLNKNIREVDGRVVLLQTNTENRLVTFDVRLSAAETSASAAQGTALEAKKQGEKLSTTIGTTADKTGTIYGELYVLDKRLSVLEGNSGDANISALKLQVDLNTDGLKLLVRDIGNHETRITNVENRARVVVVTPNQ